MMRDAFRCLSLCTLVLLPLLLGAEAVPMFRNHGSEGNELLSAAEQFFTPHSGSSPSSIVAHMGLSHQQAGESHAVQLPHGISAVSGNPPHNPYPWWLYAEYLVTGDISKLYSKQEQKGPRLPIDRSGGYIQPPQGIDYGAVRGSRPSRIHDYPQPRHARFQPYELKNTDRPSYAVGQQGEPFPSASGSPSGWQVPATHAAAGDSHLAPGLDAERASWKMGQVANLIEVGPDPLPTLPEEMPFLLHKAVRIFSDNYINRLRSKATRNRIYLSDTSLDNWLLRMLNARQQLLQHEKGGRIMQFELTKEDELSHFLPRKFASSPLNPSDKGPFEKIQDVLADFQTQGFTFHVRTARYTRPKSGDRIMAFKKIDGQVLYKVYFGHLYFKPRQTDMRERERR